RIAQQHHLRPVGHAHLLDHLRRPFGLLVVFPAAPGAVLLGVVALEDGQTQAAGGQQQTHEEAVTIALGLLLALLALVLGVGLPRALAAWGGGVAVLHARAVVTTIGLVKD